MPEVDMDVRGGGQAYEDKRRWGGTGGERGGGGEGGGQAYEGEGEMGERGGGG